MAALVLACGGCLSSTCDDVRKPSEPEGVPETESASTKIPIDIYIDATPSLVGFFEDPGFARFVRDDIMPTGRSVTLHRAYLSKTGMVIERVEPEQAGRRELFSQGDTNLSAVVDSVQAEHLSVIVTDLYETEGSISRLSRALARRFLVGNNGVGMMMIPTAFNGAVYDAEGATFAYNGSRPLYLLLLGPIAAIEAYRAGLLSRVERESMFTLITRQMLAAAPHYENPHTQPGAVFKNRIGTAGFEIHIGNDTTAFSAPVALSYREGAPVLTQLRAVVDSIITCKDKSVTDAIRNTFQVNVTGGPERFIVRAALRNGKAFLLHDFVRYQVHLEAGRLATPAWITERDLALSTLEEWKRKPSDFDGTKTLGLKLLTQRLQEALMEPAPPELGRMYLILSH